MLHTHIIYNSIGSHYKTSNSGSVNDLAIISAQTCPEGPHVDLELIEPEAPNALQKAVQMIFEPPPSFDCSLVMRGGSRTGSAALRRRGASVRVPGGSSVAGGLGLGVEAQRFVDGGEVWKRLDANRSAGTSVETRAGTRSASRSSARGGHLRIGASQSSPSSNLRVAHAVGQTVVHRPSIQTGSLSSRE